MATQTAVTAAAAASDGTDPETAISSLSTNCIGYNNNNDTLPSVVSSASSIMLPTPQSQIPPTIGSMNSNFDNVNNSVPVIMPNSMPSFFANPFMTPFMPQQAAAGSSSVGVGATVVAGGASGTAGTLPTAGPDDGGEYRSNPLQTDNYLLQSLQCQEMMQHYIQSLMAAASQLPNNSNSNVSYGTARVPDDGQEEQCYTSTTTVAGDSSGKFQFEFPNAFPTLIQSMQQQLQLNNPAVAAANPVPVVPVDPVSSPSPSVSSAEPAVVPPAPVQQDEVYEPNVAAVIAGSSADEKEVVIQVEKVDDDPKNDDDDDDDGTAKVTKTVQETDERSGREVSSTDQQESATKAEEEIQENDPLSNELITRTNDDATCSSNSNDSEMQSSSDKKEENPENQKNESSSSSSNLSLKMTETTVATTASSSASSSSSKGKPGGAAENSGGATIQDECRTSVLIKKQMNEIDKEIHRRIQNKNIKKIDEKELALLLSTANSSNDSITNISQQQYTSPSIYAVHPSTTEQSALPFVVGETRKASSSNSTSSSPKPSLEQLRNSFGLSAVSSDLNSASSPSSSSSATIPVLPSPYVQDQQYQHRLVPPYLGIPGGAMLPDPTMVPAQNRCSPSLPTTVEHFTQAGAAAAAAAAALGTMPQSYPQFQPYFPPPHAFYFPGAQQHVSPQLAAAILQQFQHGQALNMFPNSATAAAPTTTFAFPAAPQSSSSTINGSNNSNNKLMEDGCQHLEMVSNMQQQGDISTRTSGTIGAGRSNNGNCLDPKIPPPPAAPINNVQRKSLSQNGPETTTTMAMASSAVQNDQRQQQRKFSQMTSQNINNWPGESGWIENGKHTPSKQSTMKNGHTEDQDESSAADGEPVWVMRDTYLKRIQREEDRSNSEQQEQQQQILEMNKTPEKPEPMQEEQINETESLLSKDEQGSGGGGGGGVGDVENKSKKGSKKEVIVHEPAVLIEGVLFRARYLGSTQLLSEGRPTKASRMMQAQEAVARVKAPAGEIQPSTDIDLFISTEKIMVLNTDLQRISDTDVRQDILMDHALRTISYIADIGDLVVLMARRMSQSSKEETFAASTPRVICHVFESDEASFIAQSIGQAFQVAYVEFLRANGIDDPSYLREIDYQEVLNSQELMGDELEMFARKEAQKDVVVPKKAGEPLGVVVVESGWGSMLPTVVIANLQPNGAASRCNHLNIGDQIIAINGISLVGLPLASAQQNIKATKSATAVRLTVVSTPPVVEVRIKRPDTKYQLGFSVQNGVICSLLRGGIAERGGIRVGHRIIEINSQSVVAVPHERIVNMLATAIGEIHMKTMPTSMFRLLTGQEVPNYI